ncbi:MAG: fasciclin domain-containing protein [Bacteroidota bacterium]|nr:fasciclin domain-containing protein [Bacteroidota bacterium]
MRIAKKAYVRTIYFFALSMMFLLVSCRKKAFDEFYGRPAGLPQPIYQQLQAKGSFKNLLACIDKAGYKDILSSAGYWTFFAPNDSAFISFFKDRGINDVSQIDTGTAKQIVTFSLVYNAFTKSSLADYQSNGGWLTGQAFRRRTANYIGFYNDTTLAGQSVVAFASNRNNTNGSNYYVNGDNNNKYITYFVDNFMSSHSLTANDYNYFYPNSNYTGFNVGAASVVNSNIAAENGYIHEVNRVLLPLPSIDKYLSSNPQYSEFKKLFDKYMVQFVLNSDATNRYKLLTGLSDNVYIKTFNPTLAFSPNNENYLKMQDNDGQSSCWTMFVPTNDVLDNYINSVLLEHYKSLDQIPIQIIIDFLNAHMWQTAVWPSKFATTTNYQAEPARFNPSTDIVDKQILSNGIFYGTNKVQQANVFSTVYGRPYLDPDYQLMTKALDQSIRYTITVPSLKFTVFMMSDATLRAQGFDWNIAQSAWQYTAPGTTTPTIGNTARDMLQRILATHIVPTPNGEMNDLSGSGIIETLNGEYITWNGGTVQAAGNVDVNSKLAVVGSKLSSNGKVYYCDNNLLYYSNIRVGLVVKRLGAATSSNFNYFYQLLSNSPLYNATTGDILGVQPGVFYTLFIPTNAAITQAVKDGVLPGNTSTGAPKFKPSTTAESDQINNFILYHILNKTTVIPDGKKPGAYETLYKKASGDPGTFSIASSPGTLQITDDYGRTAKVIYASSNNLADRCVIHLIDNYLKYNPN